MEFLQWLHTHQPQTFDYGLHLDCAIRNGRLDMAKWLQGMFLKHFFKDPEDAFDQSLLKGPYEYDFDMIRWVAYEFDWADVDKHAQWTIEAMKFAAKTGKLDMLKFLHDVRVGTAKNKNDQVAANEVCDLILDSFVMNEMAGSAQLADIQCWTSSDGSIKISESYTTEAMDQAACNGHLEVVQWLHDNRQEGCTYRAMDLAAIQGHLEIVKWLHENRTEGCTSRAMNLAAKHGHLDVIQFLHANRREGYTVEAQGYVVAMGHYETFRWLQEIRSEPFVPELELWRARSEETYESVLKCQALYTRHDSLGWFVDCFIAGSDFETVEQLLPKLAPRE